MGTVVIIVKLNVSEHHLVKRVLLGSKVIAVVVVQTDIQINNLKWL